MIVMDIAGQCQNEQNPQVVYFEVDTCPLGRLPNTVDINNTRYALYCMKYGNGTHFTGSVNIPDMCWHFYNGLDGYHNKKKSSLKILLRTIGETVGCISRR